MVVTWLSVKVFLDSPVGKDGCLLDVFEPQLKITPNYKDSMLYIDSMLRQKVPTDEHVYFGHKAAIDTLPFLFDPTITALK
jgi:hypothetical protein